MNYKKPKVVVDAEYIVRELMKEKAVIIAKERLSIPDEQAQGFVDKMFRWMDDSFPPFDLLKAVRKYGSRRKYLTSNRVFQIVSKQMLGMYQNKL